MQPYSLLMALSPVPRYFEVSLDQYFNFVKLAKSGALLKKKAISIPAISRAGSVSELDISLGSTIASPAFWSLLDERLRCPVLYHLIKEFFLGRKNKF